MSYESPQPQKFGRFTVSSLTARVIKLILGAITGITLARVLGPAGKGNLTLLLTIPSFAYAASNLGLGVSISYHCGKERQDDVLLNGFTLFLALGIITTFVAALFLFTIRDQVFSDIATNLLLIALLLVFLTFLFNYTVIAFQALYQIFTLNILLLIHPATYLLLVITLLVFMHYGLDGALTATGAGMALTIIAGLIILSNRVIIRGVRINLVLQKKMLFYGSKVHSGAILQAFSARIDYWLLAYFLDPAAVGYYALATSLGEMLWIIPASVQEVLQPRIMRFDDEYRDNLVKVSHRMTVFVLFLAWLGMILIGKPLIRFLYGPDFLPSYRILMYLLPGVISFASVRVLSVDIYALGKPLLSSLASGIILITISVADFLLIQRWEVVGAAFGYSLAYVAGMFTIIIVYRILKGVNLSDLFIPKKDDFRMIISIIRGIFRDYSLRHSKEIATK